MPECPYLLKNGKKCSNKLKKNQIVCNKHGGNCKNQKGGFLTGLIYPMGVSVGVATFALFKINNIVGDWYVEKKKNKKRLVDRR